MRAAVAYFNKWGWWRDPVRKARNLAGLLQADINAELLQRLSRKG
jgi:hypothetical protein